MAPSISNIGTCLVTLNLFDGINNVPYLISIVTSTPASSINTSNKISVITSSLSNIGPPVFLTALKDQIILAGDSLIYNLPQISDPDNDSFKVNILLLSTTPFAKSTNSSITFLPTNKDANLSPYKVKIILTDDNLSPKSIEYYLSVTINPLLSNVKNTTSTATSKYSNQNTSSSFYKNN